MILENGALVEFYNGTVQNRAESAKQSRPIFDDVVFVKIQTPGDTKTVIETKCNDQHKARYPKAWDAFQRSMEDVVDGMPLTEWTGITASQVKELLHCNVRSVEALCSVSDANIQRLGPGYMQLRENAKRYLTTATDSAAAEAAALENEKLREEMAAMAEQMKVMQQQIASMPKPDSDTETETKRGPGRPPKTQE